MADRDPVPLQLPDIPDRCDVQHDHVNRFREQSADGVRWQDVFRGATELEKASLLRHRTAVPQRKILRRKPPSERKDLVAGSAWNRRAIGQARLAGALCCKPQSAQVFDSVKADATGNSIPLPVVFDR